MSTFHERAKKFGHSAEALEKGHEVTSTVMVKNLDELRELLDGHGTEEGRKAHMTGFQAGHANVLSGTSSDIDHVHTRAAAALFGTHKLSDDDKQLLETSFPLAVHLTSSQNKTISSEWDLGTQGPPAVYNIATLTINPGGSIKATATAVTMTCDKVVNNATGGSGAPYTIGIFGMAGSAGTAGGAGTAGSNGSPGKDAGTPSPGICTGARTPTPGGEGQPGGNGGDGQRGGSGFPNQPASFTFYAVSGSPIVVATQSGPGGAGGAGGVGGRGGDGGKGGDGCQSGCEGTASADGGNGANGGNGGTGGQGGNAVNGQPINILLGKGTEKSVIVSSPQIANPGAGGPYGAGGDGGQGGAGGSGSGKHRSAGRQGTPGQHGGNGSNGDPGQLTGQPGQISVTVLSS